MSDFLCEAITKNKENELALVGALDDKDEEFTLYIMNMLADMGSKKCLDKFLEFILWDYSSPIKELATEHLKGMANDVKGQILSQFNDADESVKEKIQARLDIMRRDKAQFLVLHPPYDDIIKFSDRKEDLSNCASTEEFYDLFQKVAKNGYDMLEKGRFAALIIGDKYANGEIVPLGADCAAKMREIGFKMKAVIVKNMEGNERAKGKTANLWRYRALNGGFYIFKHEYIYVFQKV